MNKADIENLITEYGRDIFSFCYYITRNNDLAEDLYQDTFLTVLNKLDRLNTEKNVKSYIMGVAVKLWKNHMRKETRRSIIAHFESSDSGSSTYQQVSSDVAEDIEQKEELEHLINAVSGLPDKFKVVIVLHYVNGMLTGEIAASLNIPKGTVLSRLHKARKLLKEEMEKRGY